MLLIWGIFRIEKLSAGKGHAGFEKEEIHAADVRVFTDLLGPLDIETNYKKAAELGVDLIQTDKPALVFKTLNR